MNKKFTVEIASVPDRDSLVAEIWFNNMMLAELSNHNGKAILEIYPNKADSRLNIECEEFIKALLLAEKKLFAPDGP